MFVLVTDFCHTDSRCLSECKCTVKTSFMYRYCSLLVMNLKQICKIYKTMKSTNTSHFMN